MDDIVLYISDPCETISAIEHLLMEFGVISGLHVNQFKTELYPVSLGKDARRPLEG